MLLSNRYASRSAGLIREVLKSAKLTVPQRAFSNLHMTPTPQEFLSDNIKDYKKLYIGFIRKVIKADTVKTGEGETAKPANLYEIAKLDEKPVVDLLKQVLQKQFNYPVLMNILSQINSRVCLPADLSSEIMKKFLKYGDEEHLFNFRRLLCMSGKDKNAKYNLSIADINAAITKCFESDRYIEAMKWYITAHDELHLVPNRETFVNLIKGLTPQTKWDEIIYILSDMKFLGVPLPRTSADAILARSADHPASRWRLVGMVMDDMLQQSLSAENQKKGSTQYVMTPAVMKDAMMTVLQARQPLAVLELYSRITAAYEQPEMQGAPNRLPIHSDHIVEPVGMAAIAMKNHSALCQVMRDNVAKNAKAPTDGSSPAAVLFDDLEIFKRDLSPEEAANEYAALLATDCVSLLQSRNPTTCGRHFAVAILWSLNNGKTVLAAQLWNHFIAELIASLQTDKNQQSETVVAALTQVLAACSRSLDVATVDLETYRHNKRVARFLSSALFNMNSSVATAGAAAVLDLSVKVTSDMAERANDAHFPGDGSGTVGGVSSRVFESILSVDMKLTEDLARDLLSVFTCLQDNKFCFEVLSRCLKHGTVVEESAMNEMFNLLLSDGDYKLILDLCEYQIKQLEDQYAAKKAALLIGKKDKMRKLEAESDGQKKASTYDKYLDKQKNGYGNNAVTAASTLGNRPRAFSPYVYMVAMRSLLAVGEVESALKLLNDEIPAKGYFATNGCYEVAVRALSALGRHADAVAQFRRGVAEKEEYLRLNKELPAQHKSSARLREAVANSPESLLPMRKMVFSNYVKAADSLYNNADLLLLTLQCCAKARLGMDAMAIFDERDALTVKGVAPVLWHKRAELVDNVVLSMASSKFIKMLPGFLRDTTMKQRGGFVPPVRTIQLAVAAAVAAKDSETIGAILEYAQQFAFRVESDMTRQDLMALLQSEVLTEAQQQGGELQQVVAFLESCEPLKDMQ